MMLRRLLGQAYLFDDPSAYEAGVRDTYALLREGSSDRGPATADATSTREAAAAV